MTSAWRPCGSGWSFCGRILILVKQFPIFQMQNEYNQVFPVLPNGGICLTEIKAVEGRTDGELCRGSCF
ncbi:hypothetical protein QQP08_008359 [Theobroma cacao]|nr:hypothetical protein QQP08_008359 [Theobroma cacao]